MNSTMNSCLSKFIMRVFIINILIFNATAEAENSEDLQCDGSALENGWNLLAEHKIFFGHQSVGNNIVNGLQLLAKKCNKQFTPLHTRNADDLNGPVFAHAEVGKNKQPETKLTDFALVMEQGMGEKVDIAFMKFCYIDFQADTNVDELFVKYRDTLTLLRERHPNTIYLAVSAPLTTLQTGIKARIKSMLGLHTSGIIGNIKRQEFNDRLRLEYAADNRLFDIARIESTLPNGSREKYRQDGKEDYSLYEGYTNDGGHLNEVGQLHVAQALLDFMGKI